MKILIITNLYPPNHLGGYEATSAEISEKLKCFGHEVYVLTSNYGDGILNETNITRKLKISLQEGKESLLKRVARAKRQAFNYKYTKRHIEKIQPDVVYHFNGANISTASAIACFDTKTPTCFHIADPWLIAHTPTKSGPRFISKILGSPKWNKNTFSCANKIFVSNSLMETYQKNNMCEGISIVVSNGLPSDVLEYNTANHSLLSDELRVVCAGRLRENKGQLVLVNAIAEIKKETPNINITLTICGTGDIKYEQKIRDTIKNNHLENVIKLTGEISRLEVLEKMATSDGVIVPSLWEEPFGLVAIEGMALGKPVLASKIGGLVDIVINNETGNLVKAGDTKELSTTLIDWAKTPEVLKSFGEKAKNIAIEKYRWADKVRDIENCLLKTASFKENN